MHWKKIMMRGLIILHYRRTMIKWIFKDFEEMVNEKGYFEN
jgi:hypothetical protein